MKLRHTLLVFAAALSTAALFSSCASKGAPSPVGELMTVEQLAALPEDGSAAGKLIAVDGYMDFCRMANMINLGRYNLMQISSGANCTGEKLIMANISIHDGDSSTLMEFGGEKSRNFITLSKDKKNVGDNQVTLDDYSQVDYGKFRFSGELTYKDDRYVLEKVTIHNAE